MAGTVNEYIGLPGAAAAITIGKATIAFIDGAKEAFDEDDQQVLVATRELLATKVRKHSVETEESLRG